MTSRAAVLTLALLVVPAHADRVPTPTLGWAIMQAVPSTGFVVGEGGAAFSLRWQITPLLFSFGVRREVTPWRSLVVEPMLRYGGSLELFAAGEYVGRGDDRWGLRSGGRLYLPLVQHGENLAMSIGASHLHRGGDSGLGIELGGYVLWGVLGIQLTYAPPLATGEELTVSFSVRYF